MNLSDEILDKSIFDDIKSEMIRQDEKWGARRHQNPFLWITILMEEVGEAAESILKKDWNNLEVELIQCTAVLFQWLKDIHRNENSE